MTSTPSASFAILEIRYLLGIGPHAGTIARLTFSNRVTHASDLVDQTFTGDPLRPRFPSPRPHRRVMKRDRKTRPSQREKVAHVTAPPIGLCPRIPYLLEKGYPGWSLPLP